MDEDVGEEEEIPVPEEDELDTFLEDDTQDEGDVVERGCASSPSSGSSSRGRIHLFWRLCRHSGSVCVRSSLSQRRTTGFGCVSSTLAIASLQAVVEEEVVAVWGTSIGRSSWYSSSENTWVGGALEFALGGGTGFRAPIPLGKLCHLALDDLVNTRNLEVAAKLLCG